MARFSVEKVVDLRTRGGLLASGKVLAGNISAGTVLQDETTGARTTVLALEFLTPAAQEAGRVTLVLERTDPSPVVEGRVLTSPARRTAKGSQMAILVGKVLGKRRTQMIRFSVEEVFDIPTRGGLLALGTVLEGVISAGTVLRDETTGAQTTVLGIEFVTPRGWEAGRRSLILERTDPSPVVEGRVLTSPT